MATLLHDHFHGIKSLFCPMEHINFHQLIKNVLNILLSKPVSLYPFPLTGPDIVTVLTQCHNGSGASDIDVIND